MSSKRRLRHERADHDDAGDQPRDRRQTLEPLATVLKVAHAAHDHLVLLIIKETAEHGAGQQAIRITLQALGKHPCFADFLKLPTRRRLERTEGLFLNLVSQSGLQPGAMVVAGAFVEMRVP